MSTRTRARCRSASTRRWVRRSPSIWAAEPMTNGDRRAAIVTGAAGGLGLAVAELLAARGTQVTMVDVDGERLLDAVGRVVPGAHAVVADLSAVGECDR